VIIDSSTWTGNPTEGKSAAAAEKTVVKHDARQSARTTDGGIDHRADDGVADQGKGPLTATALVLSALTGLVFAAIHG